MDKRKSLKSEIFCYGQTKEFEDEYIELFGCNAGEYPFRYLGIPMHHRQLLNIDRRKVKECFEKLTCWKLSICHMEAD